MWRPKNWDETRATILKTRGIPVSDYGNMLFEVGADAILEALKKEGKPVSDESREWVISRPPYSRGKGYLVFIPETEK